MRLKTFFSLFFILIIYYRKKNREIANLAIEDITGVVMVGGATRMPHIRHAVEEYFQQEPLTNLDPEKVVALGAAMQANVLAGNRQAEDDCCCTCSRKYPS